MTRFSLPALAVVILLGGSKASAWDSSRHNPTRSTHTLMTEWALGHCASGCDEASRNREALVLGANEELHELPVSGSEFGLDLDELRQAHQGTNAGSDDIEGWWADCQEAYQAGRTAQAYFLLGIILHMIEDMGVPAHANGVHHQGSASEFDNFEFLALNNWKPDFEDIERSDPGFDSPADYYAFSQRWAHDDAPDYHDRNAFSKTWTFASPEERALLGHREGRTCHVALWALESACRALQSARHTGQETDDSGSEAQDP